jgi:hypothetical protein
MGTEKKEFKLIGHCVELFNTMANQLGRLPRALSKIINYLLTHQLPRPFFLSEVPLSVQCQVEQVNQALHVVYSLYLISAWTMSFPV